MSKDTVSEVLASACLHACWDHDLNDRQLVILNKVAGGWSSGDPIHVEDINAALLLLHELRLKAVGEA